MQALLGNIRIYRLWRLRRLILLSILLPFASIQVVAVIGYSGPLWSAGVPLWRTALWAALSLFHTQRYPRAPLNPITFGIATAGLILLIPLGDWLLAQVQGIPDMRHTLGLIALGFVAWFLMGSILGIALDRLLTTGKPRNVRIQTTWHSTLPPAEILPLLMPKPESSNPLRRYGPVQADGRFAVWQTALDVTAAPTTGPWGKPGIRAADYWVISVTQTDDASFTALYASPEGGTEALLLTARSNGTGSILHQVSQSDVMSLISSVLHYLTDINTDMAVGETDLIEGRGQARAICLQPLDYLGKAWVERLKHQENTPSLY